MAVNGSVVPWVMLGLAGVTTIDTRGTCLTVSSVVLVTTSRSVGTRGGVLIVPSLRTLGTLSLPT